MDVRIFHFYLSIIDEFNTEYRVYTCMLKIKKRKRVLRKAVRRLFFESGRLLPFSHLMN